MQLFLKISDFIERSTGEISYDSIENTGVDRS